MLFVDCDDDVLREIMSFVGDSPGLLDDLQKHIWKLFRF